MYSQKPFFFSNHNMNTVTHLPVKVKVSPCRSRLPNHVQADSFLQVGCVRLILIFLDLSISANMQLQKRAKQKVTYWKAHFIIKEIMIYNTCYKPKEQ